MESKSIVNKIKNIDLTKIEYDDNITGDDKQKKIKIWYNTQTFYIQTELVSVYNYDSSQYELCVTISDQMNNMFSLIDDDVRAYIKKIGLVKKLDLKNYKYRACAIETDEENIIKTCLTTDTLCYICTDKSKIKTETITNMLKKNEKIKLIIEIDCVLIDYAKKIINININLGQIGFQKKQPEIIKLHDYSFIESDKENIEETNNTESGESEEIESNADEAESDN